MLFTLDTIADDCRARAGVLNTAHGNVKTPVFMPVGTQATVKALSPRDLMECGSGMVLANTYHLHLRPGEELIREAGGLHRFTGWSGAFLTDSGGFQVFSLRDIAKVTDDGVRFQSYLDGSQHFFSPETVTKIQHALGADIIMVLDECPPAGVAPDVLAAAVQRTLAWARRCRETADALGYCHGYPQALFGIVQGGASRELRKRCCDELPAVGFDGYALGGLAVGEDRNTTYEIVEYSTALLPEHKPRYLMGVGTPRDILECIQRGIDMFDCVLPTRNARNGSAFTRQGKLNLRNASHRRSFDRGVDTGCSCYACTHFSRSYVRHLIQAGEILGVHLLTLHNVSFYLQLVSEAREQILGRTFTAWKQAVLAEMGEETQHYQRK